MFKRVLSHLTSQIQRSRPTERQREDSLKRRDAGRGGQRERGETSLQRCWERQGVNLTD